MGNWDYQIKVGGYLDAFRASGLDDTTDEGVDALRETASKVAEQVRKLPHWYNDAEYAALKPETNREERAEAFRPREIIRCLTEAETIRDFDWAYTQLRLWADDKRILLGD